MRIVSHDGFSGSGKLAADCPVIATRIGIHLFDDVAEDFTGLEQGIKRRHDLWFAKRTASAASTATGADVVLDGIQVEAFRYDQLTPWIRHALPRRLFHTHAPYQSSQRQFATVARGTAKQRSLRLP